MTKNIVYLAKIVKGTLLGTEIIEVSYSEGLNWSTQALLDGHVSRVAPRKANAYTAVRLNHKQTDVPHWDRQLGECIIVPKISTALKL